MESPGLNGCSPEAATSGPADRRRRAILLGIGAAALGGCVGARPDLLRLYEPSSERHERVPPVVLIPGLLGSRLRRTDTAAEAWPGPPLSWLAQSFGGLELAVPGAPSPAAELEPAGLTDSAVGRDFYGRILSVLIVAGGYVRGVPGQKPPDTRPCVYTLDYDWRQDNVSTAMRLEALIDQIRLDHGRPDLRVDVIAHSMGGLVVRYYARYGTADVLDGNDFPVTLAGEKKLRRVVLLGTPNLGSVRALHSLVTGFPVGPVKVPPEIVATMPSAYQLLPHAINDWIITPDGRSLERDQFDVEIWRRFRWGVFDPDVRRRVAGRYGGARRLEALEQATHVYLERARRFTWSLTVPVPGSRLRFAAFGGVCRPTPARVIVEEISGESVVRFYPGEVRSRSGGRSSDELMIEPGDGTVTKASLLGRHELDPRIPRHRYANVELDYPVFLCEEHSQLTGNPSFQDNLLHYLLSADGAPV